MNGNGRTIHGAWVLALAAGAALGTGFTSRGVEKLNIQEFKTRPFPPPLKFPLDLNVSELRVTIKEWDVPTKGAHPHDPAVGMDGALWFTEQMQNKLGRLDPTTGQFKEYSLVEGKNSGPHGLVADRDGNIWYTANFGGYIGKLDPRTGTVTEYQMPDERVDDPDHAV